MERARSSPHHPVAGSQLSLIYTCPLLLNRIARVAFSIVRPHVQLEMQPKCSLDSRLLPLYPLSFENGTESSLSPIQSWICGRAPRTEVSFFNRSFSLFLSLFYPSNRQIVKSSNLNMPYIIPEQSSTSHEEVMPLIELCIAGMNSFKIEFLHLSARTGSLAFLPALDGWLAVTRYLLGAMPEDWICRYILNEVVSPLKIVCSR